MLPSRRLVSTLTTKTNESGPAGHFRTNGFARRRFACGSIAAVTTSDRGHRAAERTLVDHGVDVKVKLAGLWTAMMLLCVYADILSLYRPGQLAEIQSGTIGEFDISQSVLVIASVIVIVPALMIALATAWKWPRGGASAPSA